MKKSAMTFWLTEPEMKNLLSTFLSVCKPSDDEREILRERVYSILSGKCMRYSDVETKEPEP